MPGMIIGITKRIRYRYPNRSLITWCSTTATTIGRIILTTLATTKIVTTQKLHQSDESFHILTMFWKPTNSSTVSPSQR